MKNARSDTLKVAVGQFPPCLLDVPGNLKIAARLSETAAKHGAKLILLPEGCLTGNALSGPDKQAHLPLSADAFEPLQRIADRHGITICPGLATRLGETFTLVQAILRPGAPPLFQRKCFRANGEPSFLEAWPDPERVVFDVSGVRVVIKICSECACGIVVEQIERADPAIILFPSAGRIEPENVIHETNEPDNGHTCSAAGFDAVLTRNIDMVRNCGIPHLVSNPVGFDGETWWPGNSFILDGDGSVVARLAGACRADRMRPDICVGTIHVPSNNAGTAAVERPGLAEHIKNASCVNLASEGV